MTADIISNKSTACVLYCIEINFVVIDSLSSVSQFYRNLNFTEVLAVPVNFIKC